MTGLLLLGRSGRILRGESGARPTTQIGQYPPRDWIVSESAALGQTLVSPRAGLGLGQSPVGLGHITLGLGHATLTSDETLAAPADETRIRFALRTR